MSIQSEITRINGLKTKIKSALTAWGIISSDATLSDCANAIDTLEVHKNIDAQIVEGASYTIPKGYHDGSGVVAGISGGGNYKLQGKSVTPKTTRQTVTSDDGFYGLNSVVVDPIPSNFKDVSSTTLTPSDALNGKVFVKADGTQGVGIMPNNGAIAATIDGLNKVSYTIPSGYHNGTGTVSLTQDIENALAEI